MKLQLLISDNHHTVSWSANLIAHFNGCGSICEAVSVPATGIGNLPLKSYR